VLNKSDTFLNGGDINGQFVVFDSPGFVFFFSLSGSGFDGFDDSGPVGFSLSQSFLSGG